MKIKKTSKEERKLRRKFQTEEEISAVRFEIL